MKLKKINETLQGALLSHGLVSPTELQKKSFGSIKSGADALLVAESDQGKTLALVIAALQGIGWVDQETSRIATQALVVVQDKEQVLKMVELFETFGSGLNIRVYGVHERTDLDEDKNLMSLGNDVLVGTPERLNEMFSCAGFDVNQLKFYMIDDVDQLLKNRLEPKLFRLSDSIGKTQRVYTASVYDERVELFMDKTMSEDVVIFDYTPEEDY